MSKYKFVDAMQQSGDSQPMDRKTIRTINKIKNEERLSSKEFLEVYDNLWKEGPGVKYQAPDCSRKFRDPTKCP